ncbi:DUF4139 domain-containing protein [Altererythrobacter sp. MF3-039]|uniref:DUF4139 domain-containing protein n=1 Tax=Altererythrobacter sp. MF3-039 TaxID=3252901 RepID=UPI00390C9263
MRLFLPWLIGALAGFSLAAPPALGREVVDASAPQNVAVTVYRDPSRGEGDAMNVDWPQGFAMISETRRISLPVGRSTIRFSGVAEGMVAVSAIVTGLPGGTIEKNRNADLLSPAALVNGMLGNRITVTRTNPATGAQQSENGIVRTRADGGLVLQTAQGYEAVRCAGIPEKLTFPMVPDGLSAEPVFTIDTQDERGGTYEITLTYLAWGFDWQAHYVATLRDEKTRNGKMRFRLMSWLSILNDNGQSFANSELMAVAGALNIESDYEGLAEPPRAAPLRLTCYPFGSTAAGSPIRYPPPPLLPAPPPPAMMAVASEDSVIMVTGSRRQEKLADFAMEAVEEALGDLKLYRVPERVSVNAQGMKQVAFLNKQDVEGEYLYVASCDPWEEYRNADASAQPSNMLLVTKNDEEHGLGVAMPMGGFTLFEPHPTGDLLVGEEFLRDYAIDQDVEIALGNSSQVFNQCARVGKTDPNPAEGQNIPPWVTMKAVITNANLHPVRVRIDAGLALQWEVRGLRGTRLKDGKHVAEISVPANGEREVAFRVRRVI